MVYLYPEILKQTELDLLFFNALSNQLMINL